MWYSRFAAVAGSFWLMVLLIPPESGQAQTVTGMRVPAAHPVGGPVGLNGGMRPPRLVGTPRSSLDPFRNHRRFRSFFPYYWPFGYYDGSDAYMSPDDSTGYSDDSTGEDYYTETQRVPVQPAREVYPVYDTVTAVGPMQVSTVTVASKPMMRLTWRDNGVGAKQVAFFLADSSKTVLSAETVRSVPFTAVLEPPPGTAYAGMTVMLSGGTLDTEYVPYHRRRH
jgi:hypothetical protein